MVAVIEVSRLSWAEERWDSAMEIRRVLFLLARRGGEDRNHPALSLSRGAVCSSAGNT